MTSGILFALFVAASARTDPPQALAQAETTTTTTTTTEGGTTTSVETTTVQAPPPAPAPPAEDIPQINERTAFMVGRNTLKLGILAFEYGIIRQVSIGSEPPAWAARAFIDVWVPNLHFKFQFLDRDPFWMAVVVSGYYAKLDGRSNVDGHLIEVPVSLFATARVHPRIHLHGEATYIFAHIEGTGDLTKAQFNGAAPIRAGQLGLMLQVRVARIVSLLAIGRYQAYVADIPFDGSGQIDASTTATLRGQLTPGVRHPWMVVGGVAVLWKHFHMSLGAGYGYYFVPGMDIYRTTKSVVPDLSLAVLF